MTLDRAVQAFLGCQMWVTAGVQLTFHGLSPSEIAGPASVAKVSKLNVGQTPMGLLGMLDNAYWVPSPAHLSVGCVPDGMGRSERSPVGVDFRSQLSSKQILTLWNLI